MKVVGIDASLTSTGVAVLGDFETKTFAFQSSLKGVERLIDLREAIRQKVAGSNLVMIEDYAFSRGNQAHQMGELGGIIRVMLHEMGICYYVVGTHQVKKFATGSGGSVKNPVKKEDMKLAVYKRWGVEFKTNDETDAFVLAKIGEGILRETGDLNKFQQEVIQELVCPKKKKIGKAS